MGLALCHVLQSSAHVPGSTTLGGTQRQYSYCTQLRRGRPRTPAEPEVFTVQEREDVGCWAGASVKEIEVTFAEKVGLKRREGWRLCSSFPMPKIRREIILKTEIRKERVFSMLQMETQQLS